MLNSRTIFIICFFIYQTAYSQGCESNKACETNSDFEIPNNGMVVAPFQEELAHTEGNICFECYDENRNLISRLVEDFRLIDNAYKDGKTNPKHLKDYQHDNNFKVSRIGILIHKECFEPGRFKRGFNVEEVIVSAFVEAIDNLIEGEERATKYDHPENAIIKSHIPRLLHFFDREVWGKNSDHVDVYDLITEKVYKDLDKPCTQLNLEGIKNCKFNPKVERYRPKLFCNRDEFSKKIKDFEANGGNAAASMLGNPSLMAKEYKGTTNLYGGNFIMFNEGNTKNITELGFKATAMHEFFHNLGYSDTGGTISYGFGCLPYMFQNSAGLDDNTIDSNTTIISSLKSCITTDATSADARGGAMLGSRFINTRDGL